MTALPGRQWKPALLKFAQAPDFGNDLYKARFFFQEREKEESGKKAVVKLPQLVVKYGVND
jgi:hypothetical protein